MTFESLGLSDNLLKAISEKGYTKPSPIQAQAIPAVLSGKDVLASAQTGTGKTASFTLPLLQKYADLSSEKGKRPIRVLILVPTRELAAQVQESIKNYSQFQEIRSLAIFGGVNIKPQIDKLRTGIDFLVATPGRLLDLDNQKALSLKSVETLILDEADRMLDMGFIHDIKKVIKKVPAKRQNLLFSATFSKEIKELTKNILHDPIQIEIEAEQTTAKDIEQEVYRVSKNQKTDLVKHLIKTDNLEQVLIFTRTKHGANRLCEKLNKVNILSAAIHGNKSQAARTKALAGFKAKEIKILVATDIAARGLDIKQLPLVMNFELPNVPEDYVHRIGRTGRAGSTGHAISLVSDDEAKYLKSIEKLIEKKLKASPLPKFKTSAFIPPKPKQGHPKEQRQKVKSTYKKPRRPGLKQPK